MNKGGCLWTIEGLSLATQHSAPPLVACLLIDHQVSMSKLTFAWLGSSDVRLFDERSISLCIRPSMHLDSEHAKEVMK